MDLASGIRSKLTEIGRGDRKQMRTGNRLKFGNGYVSEILNLCQTFSSSHFQHCKPGQLSKNYELIQTKSKQNELNLPDVGLIGRSLQKSSRWRGS